MTTNQQPDPPIIPNSSNLIHTLYSDRDSHSKFSYHLVSIYAKPSAPAETPPSDPPSFLKIPAAKKTTLSG